MTWVEASTIVRFRTVVTRELHHACAGEIALEADEEADVRAAEAVDRLVRIADRAHVGVGRLARARAGRHEQAHQAVLQRVDVLVLVDRHVAITRPVLRRESASRASAATGNATRSSKSTRPALVRWRAYAAHACLSSDPGAGAAHVRLAAEICASRAAASRSDTCRPAINASRRSRSEATRNSAGNPKRAACSRRIAAPSAWNVATVTACAVLPSSATRRSRISSEARRGN